MKLYKVTIKPISTFATLPKGDTIFGQLCWSIKYRFGEERLEKLLSNYDNEPFLIVSDAFVKGYLPKPNMPHKFLKEDPLLKKENRKKVWMKLEDLLEGNYKNAKTNKDIKNIDKQIVTIHNALNYKTFHTGDGFDPYGIEEFYLSKKDIYFLLNENSLSFKEFKEVFELFSQIGFGKKVTIGKGRFEILSYEEININNSSKFFMSLSPFSANGLECKDIYYEPFTRFGKFGADRAYKNAFKKPILLADTASVVEYDEKKSLEDIKYIGKGIRGVSDIPEYSNSVHQGYAIVLPLGEAK